MGNKVNIFEIQENNMVDSLEGQKILLYGASSTGKTYQSTRLSKSMLLMTESGGNARTNQKFPVYSWDTFVDIVNQLTKDYEKAKQMYQTIIVDTVEELVALVEDKVARMYGATDVGTVQSLDKNNPNGYTLSRTMFKKQINLLTKYGYTVVFIAHETEDDEYVDPLTGKTTKKIVPFGSNKEKSSSAFIKNLCDFTINVRARGVDLETGKTYYSKAICTETPHIFARSRYTQMQPVIEEFTAENLEKAILEAIRKEAEQEGAGLASFQVKNDELTKEDYFTMIKPLMEKAFNIDKLFVANVIAKYLGENKKLTDATDSQIIELSSIYEDLNNYCLDRNL